MYNIVNYTNKNIKNIILITNKITIIVLISYTCKGNEKINIIRGDKNGGHKYQTIDTIVSFSDCKLNVYYI